MGAHGIDTQRHGLQVFQVILLLLLLLLLLLAAGVAHAQPGGVHRLDVGLDALVSPSTRAAVISDGFQ